MDIRKIVFEAEVKTGINEFFVTPSFPSLFMGDPKSDGIRSGVFETGKSWAAKCLGEVPHICLSKLSDTDGVAFSGWSWHAAILASHNIYNMVEDSELEEDIESVDIDRGLHGFFWLNKTPSFQLPERESERIKQFDFLKRCMLMSDLYGQVYRIGE